MISQETLNMKLSANKLIFSLVTHTVDSNAHFGSYGILMSAQGAEHFLDRMIIQASGQV
jgi:hypothetical protein